MRMLPGFFRSPGNTAISVYRLLLFILCLLPAASLWLGWQAAPADEEAIEALVRASGEWAFRLLLLTLSISPLRRYTGLHWLLRLRRTLGLFCFAYASAHLLLYLGLQRVFIWPLIAHDLIKQPLIGAGMLAFALLLPLALTSNRYATRRLGGQRWRDLHRTIYPITIFVLLHYWWMSSASWPRIILYSAAALALLALRGWWRELERRRQLAATPPPGPPAKLKHKVIRIVPK